MCGISGFWGDFEPETLARMNAAQVHRGPDDAGELFLPETGLGLAHRRLSIIDVNPRGRQPMWDATGRAAIVFNGEIFNYQALREELLKAGYTFRTETDTEVLLNLYLQDGKAMLGRLNGMFAFALWDADRQTLLLARDGMGVKPLYYAETGRGLLFASEMKAVLAEPSFARRIDPRALDYHLAYLWCPAPKTLLEGVYKLAPGHVLTVKNGRVASDEAFYDLPYTQAIQPVGVAQAARQVREAVRTAVARQMVADVPVGAFLSGGLDSSAVVACAAQTEAGRDLQCFTIAFQDESFRREGFADDLPYARQVARHLGVRLHEVEVGPEIALGLEEMLFHLDEPLADPAPLNVRLICELARAQGVKVLLSGTGGDDIFTGYRRHRALMLENTWAWLPLPARRLLKTATSALPVGTPALRRLSKAFRYADLPPDERLSAYFNWSEPAVRRQLYSPALREALRTSGGAENPLLDTLSRLPEGIPSLQRMLYLEGKHFLADHNLIYTDKMSMAAGVEVRVPLLDPDLVALAARLPLEYRQRGAEGKWIFKQAMAPLLPKEVIDRPKTGFGAPMRYWLRGPLKPMADEVLSSGALARRGWFDPAAVRHLREDDAANRRDAAYTVFGLVCLELWARRFLDG